jgi:hypothetical protein
MAEGTESYSEAETWFNLQKLEAPQRTEKAKRHAIRKPLDKPSYGKNGFETSRQTRVH